MGWWWSMYAYIASCWRLEWLEYYITNHEIVDHRKNIQHGDNKVVVGVDQTLVVYRIVDNKSKSLEKYIEHQQICYEALSSIIDCGGDMSWYYG